MILSPSRRRDRQVLISKDEWGAEEGSGGRKEHLLNQYLFSEFPSSQPEPRAINYLKDVT